MDFLMKNLFTLFLLLVLAGCFARSKPMYDLTVSYDQSAPPEWKLGWQHGCESGLGAYGNDYYKSLYPFHQDVSMVNNEYYWKAWNDGLNYCRAFINRTQGGDSRKYEEVPSIFSGTDLSITKSNTRHEASITKNSLFGSGGRDERGLFSDMFDVKTPGYGSTAWRADPYGGKCDWLGRCGSDIPKDPIDALMGH